MIGWPIQIRGKGGCLGSMKGAGMGHLADARLVLWGPRNG